MIDQQRTAYFGKLETSSTNKTGFYNKNFKFISCTAEILIITTFSYYPGQLRNRPTSV